jgi:hypothetical protein
MLVALHEQPDCVVTVTVPELAAAEVLTFAGVIEYVQLPPICDTVKSRPATFAVPVRNPLVFAATSKVTVPGPVRSAPSGNVRNPFTLDALQVQPACVVTVIVPLVPAAGALALMGVMA